jgi:hypothetical protein
VFFGETFHLKKGEYASGTAVERATTISAEEKDTGASRIYCDVLYKKRFCRNKG